MLSALPINGETWLICGGRDFCDWIMFEQAMNDLIHRFGVPRKVVHGGARGADMLAGDWAKNFAIEVVPVKADWTKYGKSAGPIRNQEMFNTHNPHKVIAFPGGKGTANMIGIAHTARAAGIEVDVVEIKSRLTSAISET